LSLYHPQTIGWICASEQLVLYSTRLFSFLLSFNKYKPKTETQIHASPEERIHGSSTFLIAFHECELNV